MKVVFDSSSFAKRYVEEDGSQKVEDICNKATILGVSVILVPEVISGLTKYRRENKISNDIYRLIKDKLKQDIEDAQIIQITPKVIACSIALLENNVLRAMDALHIACAIEWGTQNFVSSDKQQIKAAKKAGLNVTSVI